MKSLARTFESKLGDYRDREPVSFQDAPKPRLRDAARRPRVFAERSIDAFILTKPETAKYALSSLSRAVAGAEYIGAGAFSSVYRQGDEVVKILRHTATMSDAERQAHLESRQHMTKDLQVHMGELVTSQELSIEQHILGKYKVVTARQPYVDGEPLNFFELNTLDLARDDIADLCERQPTAQKELDQLVTGTFDQHYSSGLVPDLNGNDNFRLVGPNENLRLIDAEPISHNEHPKTHDHILQQAEVLGDFINAA